STRREASPLPPAPTVEVSPPAPSWQRPAVRDGAGPELLEPAGRGDDVVATVGDVQLRKSDVYDRLVDGDPQTARLWLDLVLLDAVVADFAKRLGVSVHEQEIEELARDAEAMLRTQVEVEFEGRRSFAEYLAAEFGLDEVGYARLLRDDLMRTRYRGLVIRYLALREERAEIRLLVHPDEAVLQDARARVEAGADFGALARRLSEDATRTEGGRLGPFDRGFRHPVAQIAFELQPGEVSGILSFEDRAGARKALVYCLARHPARDETFAALRDEIVADLDVHPVSPLEQGAFVARYCRSGSALDSVVGDR
ncbi:MAG: peptidylprolyl isomerase, partial [Planctomycetota bacterium]|nr:peptidylprolyl isomerase [Planctomycetota bacterium]